MGARRGNSELHHQWLAGWLTGVGEVMTRSQANGPQTFRFDVMAGSRTWMFRSVGELAMALYQSGEQVTYAMPSEQAMALVVDGAPRGDYAAAAQAWQDCGNRKRFGVCNDVASRLVALTDTPWTYRKRPEWHPAWRVNELENLPVPLPRREGQHSTEQTVRVVA